MKYFIPIILMIVMFMPAFAFAVTGAGSDPGLIPCDGVEVACNYGHFIELIDRVMDFLIQAAVVIAPILFAWAGYLYVTAAGKPAQIAKAHTVFKDVLIGFAIMLFAWVVVNTIANSLLGPEFTNPLGLG